MFSNFGIQFALNKPKKKRNSLSCVCISLVPHTFTTLETQIDAETLSLKKFNKTRLNKQNISDRKTKWTSLFRNSFIVSTHTHFPNACIQFTKYPFANMCNTHKYVLHFIAYINWMRKNAKVFGKYWTYATRALEVKFVFSENIWIYLNNFTLHSIANLTCKSTQCYIMKQYTNRRQTPKLNKVWEDDTRRRTLCYIYIYMRSKYVWYGYTHSYVEAYERT